MSTETPGRQDDEGIQQYSAQIDSETDRVEGAARAERLRIALERGGGMTFVAARTGMGARTLARYLTGAPMKLESALAIADCCHVSLDWLAAGRGEMMSSWHDPKYDEPLPPGTEVIQGPLIPLPRMAAPAPNTGLPLGLQEVDIDGLVFGLEAANMQVEHGLQLTGEQRVALMLRAQDMLRRNLALPELPSLDHAMLGTVIDYLDQQLAGKFDLRQRLLTALAIYQAVFPAAGKTPQTPRTDG